MSFLNTLIRVLNSLSEWTGRLTAWLVLLMVLLIVYDVSSRYFFATGSVALQEWQWHLFALIFLLGAAYTLKHDEHVRIDIIYQSRWVGDRGRAWVNVVGGIFFLIPFCLLIIYSSWPFVQDAYLHQEGSPDPGGLSYRFLLKGAIPLGFALLMLQGVANSLSQFLYLLGYQGKQP